MTRSGLAVVTVALTLALGLLDRAAAEPWTMSERGIVTRQDLHPNGPPLNPLRHVPDELLVKLRPGLTPAAAARALAGVPARSTKRFRAVEHLYHVKVAPGTNLHQAIRSLRRHPDVVYAEPNFVVEALLEPNDPGFSAQWGLNGPAGIRAAQAWDWTVGSNEVVVAVLDTGVDYNHEDLWANVHRNESECVANGVDDDGDGVVDDCHGLNALTGSGDPMDDHGHGTHVAGTIGAIGSNLTGVTGVAWTVRILSCKFLDGTGTGDVAGAVACLDYVASMKDRGLNIVATNNSWGGGLQSQALADAIAAQRDRGILFVAAAGNAGADNDTVRTYPCSYDLTNVVCVAATDANQQLAPFSNYGRGTVHVGAPGDGILSTLPGNTYGYLSGTSMAAPHVTGTLALLSAGWPGNDWRALKNLLLSGGAPTAALESRTMTGRRIDAGAAMSCFGPQLTRRLRPAASPVRNGGPITIAVANVYCFAPAGEVTVSILQTGEQLALRDDGLGADQTAGDGIYTATWTPPAGTWDIGFPDGSVVHVDIDAQLKPGFPVQTWHGAGSYQSGQGLHALVGNIDADPALEILVTALAQGPLYAFKADGTLMPGWPVLDPPGAVYPALGQLTAGATGLDVVSGHFASQARLSANSATGSPLPGWPRPPTNYMGTPPTTADVDGDGMDEIFTEEEDWHLHAYRADASVLTGWPTPGFIGGQERHTPAIADLDGDGRLDIVTTSGKLFPGGVTLLAHHHDGTLLAGFPVSFDGHVHSFAVVGDVDGDGQLEIVVAGRVGGGDGVYVFSAGGVLKRTMQAVGSVYYGTAIALADLDGDGVPEIIMQTNSALNVWKGNGTALAGWPRTLPAGTWLGNASPVVGDVDGDGQPDIVTVVSDNGGGGSLLVYRRDGTLLPGFPRAIAGLGTGAVPAIADIDGDGRNDIVVVSDFWNGRSGYYDKIWAFDLGGPTPHGAILWGQFMGGPKHQGRYGAAPTIVGSVLTVTRAGSGTGTVRSTPIGIDCGADCSERFVNGTVVTLTATPTAPATFGGWGGACAGQANPCTLTIDAATGVTARFDSTFTLTVSKTGGGAGAVTSSPAGIDCGTTCMATYASGTAVTLTATPAAGTIFGGWSGACTNAAGPCTVTMSAAQSVTATFTAVFSLTVATAGGGGGSITSSPAGITCGGDCAEDYEINTVVTLSATAASGSIFAGWSGDCGGSSASCTVTMTAPRSVTAVFTPLYTLGVTTSGNGSVASNPPGIACGSQCSASLSAGTVVALTATPAAGWVFGGWGGACSGAATTCNVTMTAAQSVTATFDQIFYTLTASTAGTGSITSSPAGIACPGDCSEPYASGNTVTLTATAGSGYVFDAWSGCSDAGTACTVTMDATRSVTATFGVAQTLSVTKNGPGTGTVTSSDGGIDCGADCSEVYPRNRVVTLTATPTNGATFQGWTGACTGASPTCTLTMSANRSATAKFKR